MNAPATTPAPQKITPDCQPVFAIGTRRCWLWDSSTTPPRWCRRADFQWAPKLMTHYTYWHPDQPTVPTRTPTEGEKPALGNSEDSSVAPSDAKCSPYMQAVACLAHYDLHHHRLKSAAQALIGTTRPFSSSQVAVLIETLETLKLTASETPPQWSNIDREDCSQPTHSAQEAAERTDWKVVHHALKKAQLYMENGCPAGRYTWLDAPRNIAKQYAEGRHFPSTPTQSQQPPLSPGGGELESVLDNLTNAFLKWPLPESVRSDLCATMQGPGRCGTNLLSFTEARQMFREVVLPLWYEIAKEKIHALHCENTACWSENEELKAAPSGRYNKLYSTKPGSGEAMREAIERCWERIRDSIEVSGDEVEVRLDAPKLLFAAITPFLAKPNEDICKDEQYIPRGHHIVEDADGERFVKKALAQPATPPLTSGEVRDKICVIVDQFIPSRGHPDHAHTVNRILAALPSIGDGKDGEIRAALNMACSTIREARLYIAGRGVLPKGEVIELLESAEQSYRSKLTK